VGWKKKKGHSMVETKWGRALLRRTLRGETTPWDGKLKGKVVKVPLGTCVS